MHAGALARTEKARTEKGLEPWPPGCKSVPGRSMAVVGAGWWSGADCGGRSQPVALLYLGAVWLTVQPLIPLAHGEPRPAATDWRLDQSKSASVRARPHPVGVSHGVRFRLGTKLCIKGAWSRSRSSPTARAYLGMWWSEVPAVKWRH